MPNLTKNQVEQINLCIETKRNIHLLRTQLFLNENFKYYHYWEKLLKKLEKQIDIIYWEI